MRHLIPWLILSVACGRGPGEDTGAEIQPEPSPVGPELSVTSPARGAFTGQDDVQLVGTVQQGTAAVARLLVDGEERTIGDQGTFQLDYDWQPGINLVGVRVEDEGGQRAVDGRAFHAGPVHAPGATIPDAVRMQLGPDLLDDDDRDIDDVATLIELLSEDPSFADSVIGTDIETEYFLIEPTDFSIGSAEVDLVPLDGALTLVLTLHDLDMAYDVYGVGWYDWVSTTGTATATTATLSMDLAAEAGSAGIVVTPSNVRASLSGYALTVEWFPDSYEDDLAGWTQDYLEEEVAATAEELVGELVGGYLDALAVETSFYDLDLALDIADITSATTGLQLTMDAAVWAVGGRLLDLPDGAGSLRTDAAAPSWPLGGGQPFTVAADDDFVNQMLFAFWHSGQLGNFEFSGDEIGLLSGASLPAPIGPCDDVVLDLGLPPVLSGATQEDQDADIALGEFRMAFHREDGQLNDFSVNVRTGVLIETNDAGELTLTLDNRPSLMMLEVGVHDHPEALDPGNLAALIKLSMPPLLGNASDFLPGFPPPELPVGEMFEVDALDGVVLGLTAPMVDVDPSGWLVLGGALSE